MKNKKIFIIVPILLVILIVILYIFFNRKEAKNFKIGNNTTSQEIVDYILNISSYELKAEIEISSNKNENKYILKQQYIEPDTSIQEVVEPINIAGIKISKNGNQLKIENTNLNLNTIFENYEHISDSDLDLENFIKEYKINETSKWKEENNQIIMITKKQEEEKRLYIDKSTAKPLKLEIEFLNKKSRIYILYNEVNINTLK